MAKWKEMKRLTPGPDCRFRDRIVYSDDEQTNEICKAYQNFEDIEEEFCNKNEFLDFNILYWAMIDGIYYVNNDPRINIYCLNGEYCGDYCDIDNDQTICECKNVLLDLKHQKLLYINMNYVMEFDFKDYGIVWSLVKDVLIPQTKQNIEVNDDTWALGTKKGVEEGVKNYNNYH